jgi:oligopeptide transport system permease protein
MVGLLILALFVLLATFAPMLSRFRYDQVDLMSTYQAPDATHWFGTDALGRDIWTAVWVGARVSLTVGLAAALCQMLIGVLIGCFSGLQGGKIDMALMRFVEIMIAIPFLIWVSLIMLIMSPGITSIVLAFALTQWTEIARLVRGEVLKLKETEFVIASRTMGASAGRLIARHFFPNTLPVVIVAVTFLYRPRHPAAADVLGQTGGRRHQGDARQSLPADFPICRYQPHHALAAARRRRFA